MQRGQNHNAVQIKRQKWEKRLLIQHKKRGKKRKKSRGAQTLMLVCSIPPHVWRRPASNEYVGVQWIAQWGQRRGKAN